MVEFDQGPGDLQPHWRNYLRAHRELDMRSQTYTMVEMVALLDRMQTERYAAGGSTLFETDWDLPDSSDETQLRHARIMDRYIMDTVHEHAYRDALHHTSIGRATFTVSQLAQLYDRALEERQERQAPGVFTIVMADVLVRNLHAQVVDIRGRLAADRSFLETMPPPPASTVRVGRQCPTPRDTEPESPAK